MASAAAVVAAIALPVAIIIGSVVWTRRIYRSPRYAALGPMRRRDVLGLLGLAAAFLVAVIIAFAVGSAKVAGELLIGVAVPLAMIAMRASRTRQDRRKPPLGDG